MATALLVRTAIPSQAVNDASQANRGQSAQCAQEHGAEDRKWQAAVAAKRFSPRLDGRNRHRGPRGHRRLPGIRGGSSRTTTAEQRSSASWCFGWHPCCGGSAAPHLSRLASSRSKPKSCAIANMHLSWSSILSAHRRSACTDAGLCEWPNGPRNDSRTSRSIIHAMSSPSPAKIRSTHRGN
jgi:hypothetical protein